MSRNSNWLGNLACVLVAVGGVILLVGLLTRSAEPSGPRWIGAVDSVQVVRSLQYGAYGPSNQRVDGVSLMLSTASGPRLVRWTQDDADLAGLLRRGDSVVVILSDTNWRGEGYGVGLERSGQVLRGGPAGAATQRRRRLAALFTGAITALIGASVFAAARRTA